MNNEILRDVAFYVVSAICLYQMLRLEILRHKWYRIGLRRGYMTGYDDAANGKTVKTPQEIEEACYDDRI